MSKHGHGVLISYENKGPPELWRLSKTQSTENTDDKEARLTLRHRFMPKVPVEFAGPSYFGGKDNSLVICAAKAGDIYIWDRESAVLLHHVQALIFGGDLTCLAWNNAVGDSSFMFATGTHDGGIRVWSTLSPSPRKLQPLNIDACARPPTVPRPILEGERFTESPTSSVFPPMSGRTAGPFLTDIRR
jgi:WD40 repeat protein